MVRPRLTCLLFLLAGVLWTAGAHAQQVGSIRGVVYDEDFDVPVAEARVELIETGQTAATNEQGGYVIGDVPPGQYTVTISKSGYTRFVRGNVVVTPGQLTDVDAKLAGDFVELEEFIVQDITFDAGTEQQVLDIRFDAAAQIDGISSDFLSRAGASDAEAGLKLVSGATTTGGGFAAVRGLPPRFVSTQLNSVVLPSANPDTRAVRLDIFSADIIENIQVSKTFTPDQQGTASGGAVNIVTKSIPDQSFIKFGGGIETNTQRPDDGKFLTDSRGGVPHFGIDNQRDLPPGLEGLTNDQTQASPPTLFTQQPVNAFGSPAPRFGDAPIEYDWSVTGGLRHELGTGWTIGGLATYFWEQDISHREDAQDDKKVIDLRGDNLRFGMVPDSSGANFIDPISSEIDISDEEAILTTLFDTTESEHEVSWGALGTIGLEGEDHRLSLMFLQTRLTTSTVEVAEDTRSKFLKFPGHDFTDSSSDGGLGSSAGVDPFGDPFAAGNLTGFAPFRRLETQQYIERAVRSFQVSGEHAAPWFNQGVGIDEVFEVLAPRVSWQFARSSSKREEPGTRIFDSLGRPATAGGSFAQFSAPSASADVSFFNVVFRDIEEVSTQYRIDGELPFRQWSGEEGALKFGYFVDSVERDFEQDTFLLGSTAGPVPTAAVLGSFFDESGRLSDAVGDGNAIFLGGASPRIQASTIDFRYTGNQDVDAWYMMADLPVTSFLRLIGGVRFENTEISTRLTPDTDTVLVFIDRKEQLERGLGTGLGALPAGSVGDALNVGLRQEDVLPSIGAILTPLEGLTLRASYSETIARPTFRELTPVAQSLFLGQTPFVGNPFLKLSAVQNYDLRVDYRPTAGSLFSVSYFKKDVESPIQTVRQQQGGTDIILPVNLPSGQIEGWEIEARQNLGELWSPLSGLTIGGNATLLDTEVRLREGLGSESEDFLDAQTPLPIQSIPMTDAPEFLYNLFMTLDVPETGTQLSVFYTVRGDTLIVSPSVVDGGDGGKPDLFIPGVYETQFGTLNLTLSQKIGKHVSVKFSAKNLTDPEIQTVYRSEFLPGGDVVKTSFTKGIDLGISVSAKFEF